MTPRLPPEIQVITTPGGELYELPAKQVGCLKIATVPLILIGLAFSFTGLYAAVYESGLLGMLMGRAGKPFNPINLVFGVPFFLIGLVPIYLGVMIYGGRSTIELRDDVLIATQRSGPFRWRREVALDRIKQFQVKSSNPDDLKVAVGKAACALNVATADNKYYSLAWGYDKPMLRALADYLAERCPDHAGATLMHGSAQAIEVEERTIGQDRELEKIMRAREAAGQDLTDNTTDIPPKPADSTVVYEPHEDGLTITVPPVGVRKGSKGMFGFSIFWNGFMALVTVGWLFAGKNSDAVIAYIVFPVFWLVGIVILLGAINAGRRRAILDVVGDTLLITRKTLFKTSQQEIHRDNIKTIRRDKSGVEINDVPVLNLQVHLHKGKKVSMLSQLSDEELSWIAALLREALRVPGK
jgi:hypothetical protein